MPRTSLAVPGGPLLRSRAATNTLQPKFLPLSSARDRPRGFQSAPEIAPKRDAAASCSLRPPGSPREPPGELQGAPKKPQRGVQAAP
eukprot:1188470-Pyramimonas_sp.AAC.1